MVSLASEPEEPKNARSRPAGVISASLAASSIAGRRRGLEEGVVVGQLQHLVVGRPRQLRPAVADVDAPQPGHAVQDPPALAIGQVQPVGVGDDPAAAFGGQAVVIGEGMQVMRGVAGAPARGLVGVGGHCGIGLRTDDPERGKRSSRRVPSLPVGGEEQVELEGRRAVAGSRRNPPNAWCRPDAGVPAGLRRAATTLRSVPRPVASAPSPPWLPRGGGGPLSSGVEADPRAGNQDFRRDVARAAGPGVFADRGHRTPYTLSSRCSRSQLEITRW